MPRWPSCLWAGEEQGLIGSRVHATRIAKAKTRRRRQLQQRHRRQLARRRRHDRRGIGARLFGGTGGLDVAIAGPLHRARRGAVRAVPSGPPRRAAGSVQPRQRPHVLYAAGIPGHRVPRIERGLQQTAWGDRHRGRRGRAVSRAERARECGQRGVARPCAAGAGRHEPERPGDDRQAAVGLRRESAMERRTRRHGLSHSTGARPGRPTGNRHNSSATSRSSC